MSDFTIHKATRTGVKPLIGIYGESGTGKTYSALLLARGLAGPKGKIVFIDTESGRGSLYADVLEGGYEVIDLCEPFSPARYAAAITAAEQSGAAIIIVDSMSHEWEGPGGVLDLAGEIEQRTGKPGLHCWKTPKLEHAKLVSKLIRSSVPIVACIRAKFKSRQAKDQNGKTHIVKDDHTSPIQSEEFIYEATLHGEVMPDHSFHITKSNHPALLACFAQDKPITIKTGEAVAGWCNGGATAAPVADTAADVKALKKRLWQTTSTHHGAGDEGKKQLQNWLIDKGLLDPNAETLESLTSARLTAIIANLEA